MPPSATAQSEKFSLIRGGAVLWILVGATVASFLLVLQNFALDIFPDRQIHISPEEMRVYSASNPFAYIFDFDGSEPDNWPSMRSRVEFFEDGHRYSRLHAPDEVLQIGGQRFTHEPGRILFASIDNTDPRTNGRSYDITTPVLYLPIIGDVALVVFIGSVAAWYFVFRIGVPFLAPAMPRRIPWGWHLAGATALFLTGLYCNTGTLTPYAITSSPIIDPPTGYAYNQDHPHFRVLFDFVNGADRKVWDHAILLRRILFPVLGWPLMRTLGFELGGVLTSMLISVAAFIVAVLVLRRRVGERGAVMAGWLLALYPGAAYWAGLPYTYSLIFPASLLLMLGLERLEGGTSVRGLLAVSAGMGVAYLGYDLALVFVPATLIVLCWQRRPLAAAVSAVVQSAPIAIWMGVLTWVFNQPLQNGNSGIFVSVFSVYFHPYGLDWWWQQVVHLPSYGSDIFFASNFIFLPALFLFVVALNPFTSGVGFRKSEVALLGTGLALFLFLNLAPSAVGGWEMRGTWISRIYQPIFPAFVLFIARWWQDLPNLTRPWKILVGVAISAASLGNALIVFGPILNNPCGLSQFAYYRFYDHTDAHFLYEENLARLGRRPIGFPRDMRAVVHVSSPEEILAQRKALMEKDLGDLRSIRGATEDNLEALIQVEEAFRQVGRALAEARSAIYARRLAIRVGKGEITATDAQSQAKRVDDFIWPDLKKAMDDPRLNAATTRPAPGPEPDNIVDMNAALVADSRKLVDMQRDVSQAQSMLTAAEADLVAARDELGRLDKEEAAKLAH